MASNESEREPKTPRLGSWQSLESLATDDTWHHLYQVGIVVRDLDAAVAHFQRIGIGPFQEGRTAQLLERSVRGVAQPDPHVTRVAIAKLGDIEIELVEPIAPGIHLDFLRANGEGVFHLCGSTSDLQAAIGRLALRQIQVLSQGTISDGSRFAYFDTGEVGGLVLELYEKFPATS